MSDLPEKVQFDLLRDSALILCHDRAQRFLRRFRRASGLPMVLLVPPVIWRAASFDRSGGWPCMSVDGEAVWLVENQCEEFGSTAATGAEGSV